MRKIFFIVALLVIAMNDLAQSKDDNAGSLAIKEGPAGIYIFVGHEEGAESSRPGKVYRSVDNNSSFTVVGEVKAAANEDEFRRWAGPNSLKDIARFKKLSDEHVAYTYAMAHRNIEEYGLAAMSIGFMHALGLCYLDEETKNRPKGTKIFYKVDFTGADSKITTVEGNIVSGTPPVIEKPVIEGIKEKDSSLTMVWHSSAARSDDAFMAEVYHEKGNTDKFEKVGMVLAQRDDKANKITYSWHEKVTPNINHHYFILPVTYAGLPGTPSDTSDVISHDFKNMPALSLRKAIDSGRGVYMTWDAIKNTQWYSGIIIERSKKTDRGYTAIDTVERTASAYFDTRVIPNTLYHYRVRLLSVRGNTGDPSSSLAVTHQDRTVIPPAIKEIRAAVSDKGIVTIGWQKLNLPYIAAYFVYRAENGSGKWQLVSNRQKEASFTDTITALASGDYKYIVRAISLSEAEGAPSEPAFVHWINPTPSSAIPTALKGYTQPGKAVLVWRDIRNTTNNLVSYNVYRKKTNEIPRTEMATAALLANGFEKINDEPVVAASYTDNKVEDGQTYVYVVAGVNAAGIIGKTSAYLSLVVKEMSLGAPVAISARKTSAGVVIDWGKVMQENVEGYEIYRRTEKDEESVKVGQVTAKEDSYTDKNATAGTLYFYSVKAIGRNKAGSRSEEKGIRL